MSDIATLLARQPIYDVNLNIIAYELLFRASGAVHAAVTDGDKATSEVILNAFTALPVADVLDGKPAYINFTRNLLDTPPPIDKSKLVVEILEDIVVDTPMIDAIKKLKQAGYTIALDDYLFDPAHSELLKLADIVKLDVLANDLNTIKQQVEKLRPYRVKLLAEKVENHEVFSACKAMGFDFFQGYFLAKPQIVTGTKAQTNQKSVLKLLSTLQRSGVTVADIDKVISLDPVLTYKLLRLINSAQYHRGNPIDSIQHAIDLLGIDKVRNWSSLLALSNLKDKPQALVLSTMVRARMCQQLAAATACTTTPDALFTVGLLSALDAYLDTELPEILNAIHVSPATKRAILEHSGTDGVLLNTAIAFEQADFDRVRWDELAQLGLSNLAIENAYLESIRWSADNANLLF